MDELKKELAATLRVEMLSYEGTQHDIAVFLDTHQPRVCTFLNEAYEDQFSIQTILRWLIRFGYELHAVKTGDV